MTRLSYFFLTICFVLLLASCSEKKPSQVQLTLLQTTDVHGTIFPYDFIEQQEDSNSLANIYTLVQEARKENPNGVILLDNGDFLQGQPSIYYYNYEDTLAPHVGAEVLNFMAYDAATVGNHDIETGHAVYDRFRKQLNMPYLAANAVRTDNGEPYFDAYALIERQGIRVAVLGLTTPGIPNWLPENLWSGMQFEDMMASAKKWIALIQEREDPDVIIGMFHSGIDAYYENPEGTEYMNENASRLVAEKVPGFDIILAGHDHTRYAEKLVNVSGDTVLLLNAGSHSRALSYIRVDLHLDKNTGRYTRQIQGEIREVSDVLPDSAFMHAFGAMQEQVKKYVGRQIGVCTQTMDSKFSYFGNSRFMDFIHEVQLDVSQADISFASPLSFQSRIEKGPIYMSHLFKLYKYENLLYTISLTGREIDAYLEYSFNEWFNRMQSRDDHLLRVIQNDQGKTILEKKYYNFSSASGIDYLVDVTKPEGYKVKILGFSNRKHFYKDSSYTVALNSYRANGGGGHLTIGAGLTVEEIKSRFVAASDHDIRYHIMEYIEEKKVIQASKNSNWRIVPEDYYEWGKRRDMQLLFGANDRE